MRVNPAFVRAGRAGTASGSFYALVDRSAKHGRSYIYRLELVGLAAARTWQRLGERRPYESGAPRSL